MQARTVERVESWDSRPYSGGVGQLHELADADFSGAVSAGGTWLFLLNGRVIGVFGGGVEDAADAEGTVYEAPHESVALLYAMQQRGGETQAKYYTNDTPLSEASETLSDAKFTGYIELSENVLSGDYYVVYYGGRSMSAAFVGTNEELITGDEAFDRADDEVGVYEVVKTPVNVTELPPREEDEDSEEENGSEAATEATAGAAAGSSTDTDADADTGSTGSDARETERSQSADQNADSSAEGGSESTTGESASASSDAGSPPQSRSAGSATDAAGSGGSGGRPSQQTEPSADSGAAAAEDGGAKAAQSDGDQAFDDEREWRETTSVPTIDPADSEGGGDAAGSQARASSGTRTKSSSSTGSSSGRSGRSRSASSSSSAASGPKSTVEKLKQAVKQREQKLQAASERIDALEAERDDLESERDDLRERVEQLESERDELEATVADLESAVAAAESDDTTATTDLNAVDALSGTNLFVRYDSKGAPTLDELKDTTDPDAVNDNLRIDHHTQFDAESATVNGEPFEAFLRETTVFRFVSWAVRALPYEVRDAGHQSGLADLYEALPQVDRAELNGTVEVAPDDDTTVSRTFDVVLRDRMGNPLAVADVSTGRDPVTGDQMTALVEDATAIREGSDDLAAAMYVTGSFFQPAALETAEEETAAGGLFSRADRESFVKIGRKAGYHLCLVEDRNDAFHLTVPEL